MLPVPLKPPRREYPRHPDALLLEQGEEAAHRDGVGRAGVRVADVGGEEVDEAQRRGFAEVGDDRRHDHGAGRRFDDGERRRWFRIGVELLCVVHPDPLPPVSPV
jgi:hypothetical protein